MKAQGTDAVFMAGTGLDEINRYVVKHYRPAVPPNPDHEMHARCRRGDHEALGRLMSWIEAGAGAFPSPAMGSPSPADNPPPRTEDGRPGCRVVGITGPGGAGKSTLIDELLGRFLAARPQGRAAVLSTDPSSPASGGALLGDRAGLVYANTERVYYRSFAGRGRAGGLAACVPAATAALRGCGFDLLLVETVGTGQDVDPFAVAGRRPAGGAASADRADGVGSFVDAAVYVMTPEYGSPLQLDKIAMLEIADAVVINKADRPAARTALAEVGRRVRRGGIPVYATVACRHRDAGLDRLFAEVVMPTVDRSIARV
jgi:methylmalonyl-CoA mutase